MENENIFCIYKIINIINGKIYIGQTTQNLEKRMSKHFSDAKTKRKKSYKIHNAINKYGRDNFKYEVIEYVDNQILLNERECYWIKYYDCIKNGYNILVGGMIGRSKIWLGRKHTEETKKKMSIAQKGKIVSESTRKKSSESRKGKQLFSSFEHPNSINVVQINKDTYELINIFGSIREAEISINGHYTGNIHNVINNNKTNKTAYGYVWLTIDEYEHNKNNISKYIDNIFENYIYYGKTKIVQLDYKGNYINYSLSGKKKVELIKEKRNSLDTVVEIHGASEHNLKSIDIEIPLGKLVCITGVSGSGKSTLLHETLYDNLAKYLGKVIDEKPGKIKGMMVPDLLKRVSFIDQSPIGRTPRSNPATYTKIFDLIRELFSQTQDAKMHGYSAGRFSFNVKGGRCEACRGEGQIKIEMQFLPDMYVVCDVCNGTRYNSETLQVQYKHKHIAEVLQLTVDEAMEFFGAAKRIQTKLKTLHDVGLGYIQLGQPAPTLSGGEAQRIKLSRELSIRTTEHTMYLLDEPTTGLHFEDIQRLLAVLEQLIQAGNSIVLIEHNIDVIRHADWLIDLGPEGGDLGGRVVAEGTPEMVSKSSSSYTGKYLQDELI